MTSVDSNAVGVLGGVEYHIGIAILEQQPWGAVHNEPVLLSGGVSADILIRSSCTNRSVPVFAMHHRLNGSGCVEEQGFISTIEVSTSMRCGLGLGFHVPSQQLQGWFEAHGTQ